MKFGRWSRSIARIITTIKEIAFKHFPHQNNWKLFVIGWQNGNRFDIEFGVIRFWLKYSSVNARRVKNDNQWTTVVWARSPKTSNQKKNVEALHTVLWRIWNVDAASIVVLEQKFKLIFFTIYCWNDGICVSLDMD